MFTRNRRQRDSLSDSHLRAIVLSRYTSARVRSQARTLLMLPREQRDAAAKIMQVNELMGANS